MRHAGPRLLAVMLVAALLVGLACRKQHPAATADKHPTGHATVEALGQAVVAAVNSKTLFRVRRLFPTAALYERYFKCKDKPITEMGRYHADGLHAVMRHRTAHGKVVARSIRADQPMTKRKGDKLGYCTFLEDVPHKLLTVNYSYPAARPAPPVSHKKPKTSPKQGSWTFVTTQLAGRWYLFIVLAVDGKPIDEIERPPPKGMTP